MDPTREEILLHRIADRCEDAADWREFELLADGNAALWRHLGTTLRDDCELRAAGAAATAIAERVELPALPPQAGVMRSRGLPWSLAAATALAWLATAMANAPRPTPSPTDTGVRVVGELPRLLVEAHATPDGDALRVVSLRRVLEESFVDRAFRVGADDAGAPRATPIELASLATPTDY